MSEYPLHVIILAQGQQSRLPSLEIPKHLLALPACKSTIIERTLCQLALIDPQCAVTVVCDHPLKYTMDVAGAGVYGRTGNVIHLITHALPDPGNSSLKGIARYLDTQIGRGRCSDHPGFQTVVLLGDVVYSWDCLTAIMARPHWGLHEFVFVGSPDLSRSAGELYGISWLASAHETMLGLLDRALAKHPPSEDLYQCGQMRRWLWEADAIGQADESHYPHAPGRTWYVPIDDYTDDVDIPYEVEHLPELALEAAADDVNNGLIWSDQ